MSNLAASDIAVTILPYGLRKSADRNKYNLQLVFGDGVKTYPAGGVPVDISKLGCPTVVESLTVYDKGTSGYAWTYDATNKKLVAMQSPSHTHNMLYKNAAVADGATTRVNAGANLLGANTGSDITVTGGGANGGIVLSTALANSEPSAVAIAQQTLKVEVVGW